jgi:hypothetical protein
VNPRIRPEGCEIRAHEVGLSLLRLVADSSHEELELTNHAPRPVRFQLEIGLHSDFADIFDVRAGRVVRRGLTRAGSARISPMTVSCSRWRCGLANAGVAAPGTSWSRAAPWRTRLQTAVITQLPNHTSSTGARPHSRTLLELGDNHG